MDLKLIIFSFLLLMLTFTDGKKISIGRGSSRSTSRRTNYKPQPAPTSLSYPQQSQAKPAWQEKSPKKAETAWQQKPSSSQSHSYPASQTGLSGTPPKPNQSNVPKTDQSHSYPASQTGLSGQNQPKISQENLQKTSGSSHSYPSSQTGLSGHSPPKQPPTHQESVQKSSGYPQQQGGLSGNTAGTGIQQHGGGYPQQQGTGYSQHNNGQYNPAGAPPPYSGHNAGSYGSNNYGNQYHHPQGPPPPYFGSNNGGYGGQGGYHPSYTPQMPGYFGNYGNKGYGGVSRARSALTGVGIAGAGVGTLLTGLALWNLARSTGRSHHTVIYDNRGQPVAVEPANNTNPIVDSMLADLVNCSLTISNDNTTEVLAIPCSIASSFSPDANAQDIGGNNNPNDNTKCTVTVATKTGKEYMTTIPCSTLLNTAAENNVTEPPITDNVSEVNNATLSPDGIVNATLSADGIVNATLSADGIMNATLSEPSQPIAEKLTSSDTEGKLNCNPHPGETRDPLNPCFSVTHNLEVLPLSTTTSTTVVEH